MLIPCKLHCRIFDGPQDAVLVDGRLVHKCFHLFRAMLVTCACVGSVELMVCDTFCGYTVMYVESRVQAAVK